MWRAYTLYIAAQQGQPIATPEQSGETARDQVDSGRARVDPNKRRVFPRYGEQAASSSHDLP
jgi:hypothetical protein